MDVTSEQLKEWIDWLTSQAKFCHPVMSQRCLDVAAYLRANIPVPVSERLPEETALAEVKFTCGRHYLSVGGIAVAMEGDKCRDGDMPNEVYDPIPEYEMEHGSIGGEPVRGMDPAMIRFFCGSTWTQQMLEYAAKTINEKAAAPDHSST